MQQPASLQSDVLAGVKVLELSAIGPVPWGVHALVRMGAHVTRIQRPGTQNSSATDSGKLSGIGRQDVFLDLKSPEGHAQVCELIKNHDVLVEGMRPGVMERLGLSPARCHELNPRLIYARVTGWGQDGPLAMRAGHDINYIALSGALHAIGPKNGPPAIPLNLVGDYGGGGAFMVIGILGALFKASTTGQGSVIDVAMLDGASHLMALHYERLVRNEWTDARGSNKLDGGVPWYSVYQTQCGGYMAVGALEPQFYSLFVQGLGMDFSTLPDRNDSKHWETLRALFAERFRSRTRNAWTEIFESIDACVSPVLSMAEAPEHPHNRSRNVFFKTDDGQIFLNNAPRFAPLPMDDAMKA